MFDEKRMTRIKPASIEEVRSYCDFGDHRVTDLHASILELMDWIEEENLTDEIYFNIGLSGFLVSNEPNFRFGENMITVDVTKMKERVFFDYVKEYGSTSEDKFNCSRTEVIERFRQLIAYKFGVHRKKRAVEQGSAGNVS